MDKYFVSEKDLVNLIHNKTEKLKNELSSIDIKAKNKNCISICLIVGQK